jgi:hypothetical protein
MRMTRVKVEPRVCGFAWSVQTSKKAHDAVDVRVECGCDMVAELGDNLKEVTIQNLFKRPFNENAIYQIAGECRLHSSCPVPCAIIKASEMELMLSLPKTVTISFEG